jgi:hypothetical protein
LGGPNIFAIALIGAKPLLGLAIEASISEARR